MYNDIIISNFTQPQHSGEIEKPHLELEVGNPVCGDRIKIQIELNDDKIVRGVFRAWGCATSVATANVFCSLITGSHIETVVNRESNEFEALLGSLEPSQYHCLDILHELHAKLKTSFSQTI